MPERRDYLAEAIDIATDDKSEVQADRKHLLALLNLYDPVGISSHFRIRNLSEYIAWCKVNDLSPSGLGSKFGG